MSTDWLFSFCSKTGDGSLYIWSNANIKALNEYPSVDNVITVPQVKTIEDELVYSREYFTIVGK